MAEFHGDFNSQESITSQWIKHLQNSSYLNDVTNVISSSSNMLREVAQKETQDFKNKLSSLEESVRNSILSATNSIAGSLTHGFEDLSFEMTNGFSKIETGMDSITDGLQDIRLSLWNGLDIINSNLRTLIQLQYYSNDILNNIQTILMLPDSQKERYYHIENGMKYFTNAIYDEKLYSLSQKNFLKVLEIEEADYIALHYLGLIHLYSPNHVNLDQAENYLKNSASLSFVEINKSSKRDIDFLNPSSRKLTTTTQEKIRKITAESYYHLSVCYFLQQKFNLSIEHAKKCLTLIPNKYESKYQLAKSYFYSNSINQCIDELYKLITSAPYYSLKVIKDIGLSSNKSILDLLQSINVETQAKVKTIYSDIITKVHPNSLFGDVLDEIQLLINKSTYLDSIKALNIISNNNNTLSFYNLRKDYKGKIIFPENYFNNRSLLELIEKENKFILDYERTLALQKQKEEDEAKKLENEKLAYEETKNKVKNIILQSHNKIHDISQKRFFKDFNEVIQLLNSALVYKVSEFDKQIETEIKIVQAFQDELIKIKKDNDIFGMPIYFLIVTFFFGGILSLGNAIKKDMFHLLLILSLILGLIVGFSITFIKVSAIGKDFENKIKKVT